MLVITHMLIITRKCTQLLGTPRPRAGEGSKARIDLLVLIRVKGGAKKLN
jgi:hypothetical protein